MDVSIHASVESVYAVAIMASVVAVTFVLFIFKKKS